jgi:vitamin B12/bleomycin/antimicrobial peptide transport system ATP-binding/permease protein
VIVVYQIYLNRMLQIRWRRWLTDNYLTSWLADRNYYLMRLHQRPTDNPDQRISEDLRMLVENSLCLWLGCLNATVTLGSVVGILWALSGPVALSISGASYTFYGYMVWVAVGYVIIGTWLTHQIGKLLIGLNFYQQRCEADFRFGLVRFRENTEGMALYRGEQGELKGLRHRPGAVVDKWWVIMKRQKLLIWFTASYSQAAVVFPFIVAAPRYFSGAIQLGGLVQISNAFGQVREPSHGLSGPTRTSRRGWPLRTKKFGGNRPGTLLVPARRRTGMGTTTIRRRTATGRNHTRNFTTSRVAFHGRSDIGAG